MKNRLAQKIAMAAFGSVLDGFRKTHAVAPLTVPRAHRSRRHALRLKDVRVYLMLVGHSFVAGLNILGGSLAR